METPGRYWSGFYWEGFEPEQIGAVLLSEWNIETSSIHAQNVAVAYVKSHFGANSKYFYVTLDEQSLAAAPPAAKQHLCCHFPHLVADRVENLIVRAWYQDSFAGARASGTGNPGSKNVDFHFALLPLDASRRAMDAPPAVSVSSEEPSKSHQDSAAAVSEPDSEHGLVKRTHADDSEAAGTSPLIPEAPARGVWSAWLQSLDQGVCFLGYCSFDETNTAAERATATPQRS